MFDMLQRLLQTVVELLATTNSREYRFFPYAEGVGKFQPRVALWQPWEKESEENRSNSEGVATVLVSYARRDSFRVVS